MIFNKLTKKPKNVLENILDSIERHEKLLVTYLNQHCFNTYYEDENFRKILDDNFFVYQADLGVFLALKFLFNNSIDRIDATEMNKRILEELIKKNVPLVFVGGDFDEKFVRDVSKKKLINLVSYYNGYFDESMTYEVITELAKKSAQVFIIGMGVPKQEIFATQLSQEMGSCVIICVGSFLEYYLGTKKRTHVLFRETGFEWLFRLITEPARLWKRYLIGIPLFIYRVIKIKSKNELFELQD